MPKSPSSSGVDADGIVIMAPARRRAITAALLVGTFLASVEVMVVGPAMPPVVDEFGQAGLYPLVFSVYILAQTLTIPLYGALADRRGRRDAYLLGVVLFLAGSVVCATAGSMSVVIFGRALQGLGAGALVPLTMTIFGDLYPVIERTAKQGLFSLVWGVSSLIGPAIGGWLTETFSWRAIFWLNIVPGVTAAAVVGALLPRWVGAGHPHHHQQWAIPQLLRHPAQQSIAGAGLMYGAALLGIIGYLPVWIQAVQGGGPLAAGLALLPVSLAWTCAAFVAGRLVHRVGFRAVIVAGGWCVASGCAVAGLWTAHPLGLILFGLGMGLTVATFTVSAQEAAPRHLRGSATSLSLLSRSLGGAMAVPLLGMVAGIRPGAGSFDDIPGLVDGIGTVFRVIALFGVLGALIVTFRFPRTATARS